MSTFWLKASLVASEMWRKYLKLGVGKLTLRDYVYVPHCRHILSLFNEPQMKFKEIRIKIGKENCETI